LHRHSGPAPKGIPDVQSQIGEEANKLAANIALGRSHAGVNFRSDYEQSLILGEEVAISVLRDQKTTFNESASWKFTRFDGTLMTI
jgi:hypothetical protein